MYDLFSFLREPAGVVRFWRTISAVCILGLFAPIATPFLLIGVCIFQALPWLAENTETEREEIAVMIAGLLVSLLFIVVGFHFVFSEILP